MHGTSSAGSPLTLSLSRKGRGDPWPQVGEKWLKPLREGQPHRAAPTIPKTEAKAMKCVFCKEGETRPQRVTVERHDQAGEPIAVIHNFPAEVCEICGEEY